MSHTKRLVISILLTLFLIAFGVAGYMVLEGWGVMDALYMTVITLTTVGYGEVREMTQTTRVFTVVLIFSGVGLFLYVVGNIVQFLVEGQIRTILGRRRLEHQIARLKDHYIVCGYGRIGRVLSGYLTEKDLKVVIIDQDRDRVPVLDEDGVLYVIGKATEEGNLIKAGIERAKGLMTALGTDADNIFLLLTARQLNPELFIVARADQNETKKTLSAAGADIVVSPYDIGARRMAHAVLRPAVIDFLEKAFADRNVDVEIEEIPVRAASSLAGSTLRDSGIRRKLQVNIIGIRKEDGSMIFSPPAEERIAAGDTVIAVGRDEEIGKLEKILNPF